MGEDLTQIRKTVDTLNNGDLAYRVMLRGPQNRARNVGGDVIDRRGSFKQWNTTNGLKGPFQQRQGDHLKPGEFVKVVVINRATGYMGTARVQLVLKRNDNDSSFDESNGDSLDGNFLSIVVPDITLRPRNLKIWAERNYDVEKG